jgi:hypothetical protein
MLNLVFIRTDLPISVSLVIAVNTLWRTHWSMLFVYFFFVWRADFDFLSCNILRAIFYERLFCFISERCSSYSSVSLSDLLNFKNHFYFSWSRWILPNIKSGNLHIFLWFNAFSLEPKPHKLSTFVTLNLFNSLNISYSMSYLLLYV